MCKVIIKFKKKPHQIFIWAALRVLVDDQLTYKVRSFVTMEIELTPGLHDFKMSFPHLGNTCGKAHTKLKINDGETYLITYKTPELVFFSGEILINQIE